MNPLLTKNFLAEAAVTAKRIVKYGAADGQVLLADGVTAALAGVVAELGAALGARVDVHIQGLAEVEYGDTVTRGQWLTSDSVGRAIPAVLGVHSEVIGKAHISGVVGDIGQVNLSPGKLYGVGKIPLMLRGLALDGTVTYRVVAPVPGTIAKLWSVISGALATGDATITFSINGTPITGGVITVAESGSAAGDVDSATPSAANVVVAGDVIEATVGGANTASETAEITVDLEA